MATPAPKPKKSEERILRKIGCGWCNTGHHESCATQVEWYGKIWVCGCKTCKNT